MRELIWGKTLRSRLIRYNFFIIWVIAIFVSVCTYITASRKTLEVACSIMWRVYPTGISWPTRK